MYIELYKLTVQIFGLAVVRRLFHADKRDLLPLRGEPHDHVAFYHYVGTYTRKTPRAPSCWRSWSWRRAHAGERHVEYRQAWQCLSRSLRFQPSVRPGPL